MDIMSDGPVLVLSGDLDVRSTMQVRTAVQELVVNTVVHAGGSGLLMIWTHGRQVVCQVQDGGRITDPLVGRRPPAPPAVGHGLFTVHQVCDLVRVHRRRDGTLVRIHVNFD